MHWFESIRRGSARRRLLAHVAASILALGAIAAVPIPAQAGVFVSVAIAPPPLPMYAQPIIPGPGYIWTPGYWAWDGDGYYWVPGTWVLAPFIGALWTPGWWGWGSGVYVFHPGYWGTRVGFYGGINYGYGYGGHGYDGGYWRGGGFYYNRSVNRVSTRITNVYNRNVVNRTTIVNRTSFNGGPGGVAAHATPQQQAWARHQRFGAVAAQRQQRDLASRTPALRAATNHGVPTIAATARAGAFNGHGVTAARGASAATDARATRYAPASNQPGALRSASFAPRAQAMNRNGTGNADRMNAQRGNATPARENRAGPSGQAAMQQPDALRSASFAPRTETAPRGNPVERSNAEMSRRNAYRGNDYRAASTGMPNRYQPANNGYRAQREAPAPRAMPQYRAEAPRAEAPRAAPRGQQMPAANRGRGRGRDDHRD